MGKLRFKRELASEEDREDLIASPWVVCIHRAPFTRGEKRRVLESIANINRSFPS
jgi:hypothetical protein